MRRDARVAIHLYSTGVEVVAPLADLVPWIEGYDCMPIHYFTGLDLGEVSPTASKVSQPKMQWKGSRKP